MSQQVVLTFLPITMDAVKKFAPSFFYYMLPDSIAEKCPMPSMDLKLPGNITITLFWPMLAVVIISGLVLTWSLGTHLLLRALHEGTRARQGLFIWCCALLSYGLMCLGGFFFHCFHIEKVFHLMDVVGTGLSSLSIIAGFAAFGGMIDDRTLMQRLTLIVSALALVGVTIVAPPLLQEQLYVVPSFLAAGVGSQFLMTSLAKTSKFGSSSAQQSGYRRAQSWLLLGGLGIVAGLASFPLDKHFCGLLGANYGAIFWFFLGCNLAIVSTYKFALVVTEKNLQFTHVKRQ